MTLSEAVAQVIRGELAEREWHSDDFAEKAGRTKTTGWRHVKGKARMSIDDVEAYAVALGWTLPELLDRANARRLPATPAGDVPLSVHAEQTVSPEAAEGIRQARAALDEQATRTQPFG